MNIRINSAALFFAQLAAFVYIWLKALMCIWLKALMCIWLKALVWLMALFPLKALIWLKALIPLMALFPLMALIPLQALADFESASEAYQNQDYRAAYAEFSELAEQGDARSQTVLAIMHKYGESVPVDLEKSYFWYYKAAEQGYPPAQYNVGAMLADGSGVEPDAILAKAWLEKAADAGFQRAEDKLAEIEGEVYYSSLRNEPVPWSKNWNLRLPNQIRFEETAASDNTFKVYRIQLGAMSSPEAARQLWELVLRANENLLRPYQPIFRPGTSQNRPVWRVQIGPFQEQQTAQKVCNAYLEQPDSRTGCLVVLTD